VKPVFQPLLFIQYCSGNVVAMARLSLLCALLCVAPVVGGRSGQNTLRKAEGFVRALHFNHQLRVCNAYPYSSAIDVFRGNERLTGDAPMQYKECKQFGPQLKAGDKLEFKVGDASAGTFSIAELPDNDGVLLLVIYRHDTLSTAVSFESHVYANLLNAQVAVIDTYKGSAQANPRISDAKGTKVSRAEELRYGSVVAVNPGKYQVELFDAKDGSTKATSSLVALNRESYVIIRTGVEAQQGPSFPQELVVYPQSDPEKLHSGAISARMPLAAALVAIFAVVSILF